GVRALVARVPALGGRGVMVTLLGGGMTNRNYKVEAGAESYVLRVAGEGSEEPGIDREREIACARAAAAAGVGPEVVAHLAEHRVTLTRFVQGKQLPAEHARQPGTRAPGAPRPRARNAAPPGPHAARRPRPAAAGGC